MTWKQRFVTYYIGYLERFIATVPAGSNASVLLEVEQANLEALQTYCAVVSTPECQKRVAVLTEKLCGLLDGTERNTLTAIVATQPLTPPASSAQQQK